MCLRGGRVPSDPRIRVRIGWEWGSVDVFVQHAQKPALHERKCVTHVCISALRMILKALSYKMKLETWAV